MIPFDPAYAGQAVRWLVAMLALTVSAFTAPALAEAPTAPPKEPPTLRAGDAMQAESEQRAKDQDAFFRRVGERSGRAMRSVCAGCTAAAKPKAPQHSRERPALYKPDTAGGVDE